MVKMVKYTEQFRIILHFKFFLYLCNSFKDLLCNAKE